MEWLEFCQKIDAIFSRWKSRIVFEFDEEKIVYEISSIKYQYNLCEYSELKRVSELYNFAPFSVCNGQSYESIVDLPDMDSRRHFPISFEERLCELSVQDEEEGIEYSFQEVSNELIWYVIKNYEIGRRTGSTIPFAMFERK